MSSQSIKMSSTSTTTSSSPPTQQFSSLTLKVPIRPLPSPSSINSYSAVDKNIGSKSKTPNNNLLPTSPTFSNSINVTFPVICEQSVNPKNVIGKQTKRGRKPLSIMPSAKKHIQNLTNQRAFRQRRETYRKTLEVKNANLEALYQAAKNEIESLRKKVASLEKQVNSGTAFCGNSVSGSANFDNNNINTSYRDRTVDNSCCDIIGTSDSTNMFISSSLMEEDTHLFRNLENDDNNNNSCDPSFFYPNNKVLSPYNNISPSSSSPSSMTALQFTNQLLGQPKDLQIMTLNPGKHEFITRTHNTPETVDDIILNPLFCDTKSGDLCLCEPASDNLMTTDDNVEEDDSGDADQQYDDLYQTPLASTTTTPTTSSSQIENYCMDNKKAGRIWIVPKEIVQQCISSETPLYSSTTGLNNNNNTYNINLLSPPVDSPTTTNQWGNYYSQSSLNSISSPPPLINPLNQNYLPPHFKWVLKDMRTETNL